MTIEELIDLQREKNCGDVHLVYIGEDKWVVAHTQDERDKGCEDMLNCELNDWLESFDKAPAPIGIYVAMEDYWEEWELIPFDLR